MAVIAREGSATHGEVASLWSELRIGEGTSESLESQAATNHSAPMPYLPVDRPRHTGAEGRQVRWVAPTAPRAG